MEQFVIPFEASSMFFLANEINDFIKQNNVKVVSMTPIYDTKLIKRNPNLQMLVCFEKVE